MNSAIWELYTENKILINMFLFMIIFAVGTKIVEKVNNW